MISLVGVDTRAWRRNTHQDGELRVPSKLLRLCFRTWKSKMPSQYSRAESTSARYIQIALISTQFGALQLPPLEFCPDFHTDGTQTAIESKAEAGLHLSFHESLEDFASAIAE